MVTIYERQRKRLNLSVPEYAQLYNTTCRLINHVLNGKEMSEDMGISKILREKFNKRYDEIENNQIETTLEILSNKEKKEKEKKEKEKKEMLDWYNNEFTKEKLYEKTNVSSVPAFMENYDIYVNGHKAGEWYCANIINKNKNQLPKIREDRLIEFAKQLKDIMDDENFTPVEIKQTPRKKVLGVSGNDEIIDDGELFFEKNENKERIDMTAEKILEVYKDFSYFVENCDGGIRAFLTNKNIGYGTYYWKIKKNDINITRTTFLKLKKIVDELKQNQLETIQNTETPCVMLTNMEKPSICLLDDKDNYDVLRKLLKDRLTEEEKKLILIFGGKID